MQPEELENLEREARHLHRVFFHGEAPAEVVSRYVAANVACGGGSDGLVERVVALQLDAEAVELTVRLRRGPTALTRKIRILFYLLEARPEYLGFFVGDRESLISALSGVLGSLLQTAGKYLKGLYLVRRHGLV